MQSPAATMGERLKEIRTGRGLSLDDMARLTEVSKPMLGQIERGQSSPTINTLWKISTGLKVPLSSLLETQKAEYHVSGPEDMAVLVEHEGLMRVHTLFSYDPVRSVEAFFIEFDPGCDHLSEKHTDGVEEYIFVQSGKVEITLQDKIVVLKERQAIRFRADVPHAYRNPYKELCCVFNTIFYSRV